VATCSSRGGGGARMGSRKGVVVGPSFDGRGVSNSHNPSSFLSRNDEDAALVLVAVAVGIGCFMVSWMQVVLVGGMQGEVDMVIVG